ncbi:MAG: hypothetical protein KAT05_15620 [Spirochaetes bacterium]|nr:hypothetical protein [Spirochaetota bacterium]
MTKTVQVYDLVKSNTLRSRKTASNIVNTILEFSSTENVNIDFRNIVFASRSFCHELLTSVQNRENVHFVNTNSEINKMCEVATKKPEIHFEFPSTKQISVVN